ncbi:WG repeat-containing protein, partial [Campylobacter novaezeelandiae]
VGKLIYDWINDFSEEFAIIKLNEQYGFINKNGKQLIEPKFNYASSFNNGFAEVELNGKYGLLDRNGKFYSRI